MGKKVIVIIAKLRCIENNIHNSQPPTVTYLHHTTPPDKKQVFFAQGYVFVSDILLHGRFFLDRRFYFV